MKFKWKVISLSSKTGFIHAKYKILLMEIIKWLKGIGNVPVKTNTSDMI